MNVVCAITVIEYVARLIFIKEIKSICAAAASGSLALVKLCNTVYTDSIMKSVQKLRRAPCFCALQAVRTAIPQTLAAVLILFCTHTAAAATPGDAPATPAGPAGSLHEYTLENGLQIYVLEDMTSVPVRIEYTARAGYSAQTPKTTGFFPLYSRIFADAGRASYLAQNPQHGALQWLPRDMHAECTADSARYVITVAPGTVPLALEQLSYCAFSPVFKDADLRLHFTGLKESVLQTATSTAGFINSSIDSRIFADSPWKQESGIYPALFAKTPLEQTRAVLVSISRTWYTPHNSALFISGGIRAEQALELVRTFFSRPVFPATGAPADDMQTKITPSAQRRFVLHSAQLSPEITQVVVQYTSLSMMQANLAAAAFNGWNSAFKAAVLGSSAVTIQGEDYINVAAAHKNGSSRLIFQTLMEKNKAKLTDQIQTFVSCAEQAAAVSTEQEYSHAKSYLINQYRTRFKSSSDFMDMMSRFWAAGVHTEQAGLTLSQAVLSEPDQVQQENPQAAAAAMAAEHPFVFVLLNTDVYNKNAAALKKAGYEVITVKNSSWYTMQLYSTIRNRVAEETAEQAPDASVSTFAAADAVAYAKENQAQISAYTLSNGIPVILKRHPVSATVVISLGISGGRLRTSSTDPGLEEVLINALADNIQDAVHQAEQHGTICGSPEVNARTGIADAAVTVECLPEDFVSCITCISRALIYGSITPAQADGLIYNRRSLHRIDAGNPVYQLYGHAAALLFPTAGKTASYPALFTAKADILEKTEYTDILAAYPGLLDAGRHTIIMTGNIPEQGLIPLLESNFGILQKQQDMHIFQQQERRTDTGTTASTAGAARTAAPDFSAIQAGTPKKVQLEHRFYTDVSADKAGPRPEVLVPTTEFLDPVQYWLPAPEPLTPDFERFNALLYELKTRLQNALDASDTGTAQRSTVRIDPAESDLQAAVITFTSVAHTDSVDTLYKKTVDSLVTELADPQAQDAACSSIRDHWSIQYLTGTQTNSGTAQLMHRSLRAAGSADAYLNDYTMIAGSTAQEFLQTAWNWLPDVAPLRLYSADSRR